MIPYYWVISWPLLKTTLFKLYHDLSFRKYCIDKNNIPDNTSFRTSDIRLGRITKSYECQSNSHIICIAEDVSSSFVSSNFYIRRGVIRPVLVDHRITVFWYCSFWLQHAFVARSSDHNPIIGNRCLVRMLRIYVCWEYRPVLELFLISFWTIEIVAGTFERNMNLLDCWTCSDGWSLWTDSL